MHIYIMIMQHISQVPSQPPMLFPPTNMLGTVLCPVMEYSLFCMSWPSPTRHCVICDITYAFGPILSLHKKSLDYPEDSLHVCSTRYDYMLFHARTGQYVLENTTIGVVRILLMTSSIDMNTDLCMKIQKTVQYLHIHVP